MNDLDALRRLAIAGVVLAVALIPVSVVLYVTAVPGGDLEALLFADPATVLRGDAKAGPLWRWAMLLDMFDSYLLFIPLALFLHRRLRPIRPWLADLGTVAAFGYIFLGGASAAVLAIAGSSLIESHAAAPPAEQLAIATSFGLLRDIFWFGIWQMLDAITAGTWIFCIGWLLLAERPILGRLLVVLGLGFVGASVPAMLGIHSLTVFLAGLAVVTVVWAAWVLLQRRAPARVTS